MVDLSLTTVSNLLASEPAAEGLIDQFHLMEGQNLSKRAITELEGRPTKSLEPIDRIHILGYYSPRCGKDRTSENNKVTEQIIWLVTNRPESTAFRVLPFGLEKSNQERIRISCMATVRDHWSNTKVLLNASSLLKSISFEDALSCLNRLIEIQPENEDWLRELANLYYQQLNTKDQKRAHEYVKKAVAYFKSALEVHDKHGGSTYLEQYFQDEVFKFADVALRFHLVDDGFYLGEKLLHHDHMTTHDSSIHQVKVQSYLHFGHAILGKVALHLNNLAGANEHLELMLNSLNPANGIDLTLAKEFRKKGQVNQALHYLLACASHIKYCQAEATEPSLKNRLQVMEEKVENFRSKIIANSKSKLPDTIAP